MFLVVPGRLGRVSNWRRLGERVQARRGALGLSRDELARASGVDASTIAAIETEDRPRRAQTLGRLERALGWEEGSAQRIARGGEPTLAGATVQQVPSADSTVEIIIAAVGAVPDAEREEVRRKLVDRLNELGKSGK